MRRQTANKLLDMGTENDSMLLLAAEAFQSKNFDLAADIYKCQLAGLGDPASQQELMIKRADSLTFGGKFPEALEVYRQAAEIESLRPAHLANLIEYLTGTSRQDGAESHTRIPRKDEEAGAAAGRAGAGATCCGYEDFSCRICMSTLFEPVTLTCGHCFCKKCLEKERKEKDRPAVCRECRDSSSAADVHSFRVNVVLSNLMAKWLPSLHQASRLRREGNGLYAEKKIEAALEKYNQAILIGRTLCANVWKTLSHYCEEHVIYYECCTVFSIVRIVSVACQVLVM